MATLQISPAFVESNSLRKRVSIGGLRGFHGRKTLRVLCGQQNFDRSDADGQRCGGESDRDQEAVNILQSSKNPLLKLPREDLIAALSEKENHVDGAEGVVASGGVGSVNNSAASGARPRSERVIFTEEKARLLRKESRASKNFHDKWYHSAIASKLAMPDD